MSRAVDGNWGSWEPWGQPTVTCGKGMRERRRRCDNPRPNFCGRFCSGSDVDTQSYNTGVGCPPACGEKHTVTDNMSTGLAIKKQTNKTTTTTKTWKTKHDENETTIEGSGIDTCSYVYNVKQ